MAEVVWLERLDGAAGGLVGPKLAKLAELGRAGLTVPPGFAVTTAAYDAFVEESGAGQAIERFLARVTDPEDFDQVEGASEAIRRAVESAPLPTGLAQKVEEAYEELSDRCNDLNVPVAVRSSAVGEDGGAASFAGQYDTYLGVTGTAGVAAAIRRCWGSLFSARAISYRLRNEISHRESPMGVGVLELVDARVSGVAFSIHPVTGRSDRMVIEGSWGWGEAVVKGLVIPDHLEIGKADGRVLRYDVASKEVVSIFDYEAGTVVEAEMPRRLRERPILDDEQIAAIVEAVSSIERHFGFPVDVEWVVSRQRRPGEPVTIVQARPETVHSNAAASAPPAPAWDPLKYAFRRERR